jgi:hypothetical protein
VGLVTTSGERGETKTYKNVTLDWKFAEAITTANLIQAEAYRRLVGNPVWLVQCTREAKVTVHKCKPRPDLWAIFLSGLNVLKFQQKGGESWTRISNQSH